MHKFYFLNLPKENSEIYVEWLIMGMFNSVLFIIYEMINKWNETFNNNKEWLKIPQSTHTME